MSKHKQELQMDTLQSFKRNSFEFSYKEMKVTKMLLDFFKYEIPNGVRKLLGYGRCRQDEVQVEPKDGFD